MTTHEVLVEARNILDRRGYDWFNYFGRADCPLCPEGAIDLARGLEYMDSQLDQPHDAKQAVLDALGPLPWPLRGAGLSDTVGRMEGLLGRSFTKDEILAFFDKAIAATAPEPDVGFVATENAPLLERVAS